MTLPACCVSADRPATSQWDGGSTIPSCRIESRYRRCILYRIPAQLKCTGQRFYHCYGESWALGHKTWQGETLWLVAIHWNSLLGLAGGHQIQNASLAVALAQKFLLTTTNNVFDQELSDSFKQGLINTKWPGRCQTILDPGRPDLTWYLDGAHTIESLECCLKWFVSPGVGMPSRLGQDPG